MKRKISSDAVRLIVQVREDVWMVASVRAANPDSQITLSDEKRAVLTAIQNRAFNKDDIDEFRRDGAKAGEWIPLPEGEWVRKK